MSLDPNMVPTPCYVCDETLLERNLQVLDTVQKRTGCTILLALKGFAMWSTFPLVRSYLKGVAASSPHEAQLGAEEFGGEVHAYAPAYSDAEFHEIVRYADHICFNSVSQWEHFKPLIAGLSKPIKCALRVNPEHSEVEVSLYDPCAPGSRLGVTRAQLEGAKLDGLTGLHFHTLCEKNADALERTLPAVESNFAEYLERVSWVNFGGGHHITRPGYDIDLLCRLIDGFRKRHPVEVYLEPGEAIALNTGVLVASVLDIVHNQKDIAILDTSATAHMPDVLEMPYRPKIEGAGEPGEFAHTYRLGGLTCLAGDVIGDYSFPEPLQIGTKLVFGDMIHYTMVKTSTFNGVRLPSIAIYNPNKGGLRVVREFGYEDYRNRLS
jgi:carboxynorspermidine decarboxylase